METMSKLNEISLAVRKSNFDTKIIKQSKEAYDYVRQFYGDDIELYESFFMLLLNRSNKTIAYVKISQGGVYGTLVDPRIIAKYAIDSLAASVIVCHNHPSGNAQPSEADRTMTNKIIDGLAMFDIKVIDHLILTGKEYYSFLDNGDIN